MSNLLESTYIHKSKISEKRRLDDDLAATHIYIKFSFDDIPIGLYKIYERGNIAFNILLNNKEYNFFKNDSRVKFMRISEIDYSDQFDEKGNPKYSSW